MKLKFIILLLFVAPSISFAKITKFKLDNGLSVIVKEVNKAPVVVSSIWYKVGSADEHNGITGISHMLEHFMFKGTIKYPNDSYSQLISDAGGRFNAFTSQDYTAYYAFLPKENLELSLKLEADRMTNIIFDEKEFQREKKVVIEERLQRIEDNIYGKLFQNVYSQAFVNSPYHHPIIGWMQDIKEYQLQEIINWYEKWYIPNNAVLVIVGDVELDNIKKLVNTHFGKISAGKLTKTKNQIETKQNGMRYSQLLTDRKLPETAVISYHVPTLANIANNAQTSIEDVYALDVLSYWQERVLRKKFIRKNQTLTSINVSYQPTNRLTSLYSFQFSVADKYTIAKARKDIIDELDYFKENEISQKEFDTILAQIESFFIYSQDSIQSQSRIIGALEANNIGYEFFDNYLENISNVTPKQVKMVANKYFKNNALNIVELKFKE